jgi:hypothetical protein
MRDYRQSLLPRFSLRTMFVLVAVVSILLLWMASQMNWVRQRQAWRSTGPPVLMILMPNSAPWPLHFFDESGVELIKIENETAEQIAEAMRLFPEATIVVARKRLAAP